MKETKLEKNLKRIKIMQMLGDCGVCGEFQGPVNECPMYAIDCPQTCTYAKNKKELSEDKNA